MRQRLVYLLLLAFVCCSLCAEIVIIESKPQPEMDARLSIKHHLTSEEIATAEAESGRQWDPQTWFGEDAMHSRTPPVSPVMRPVAEFEQMSGVMIRYPLGIPVELVVEMSKDARVVTIVSSTTVRSQAQTAFTNAGVKMSNVQFLVAPNDSYWVRDFGPWYSFSENGTLNAIDFTYNRPRQNDNAINQSYYAAFDTLSVYNLGLVHCGGNYMADGIGIGASSHIVFTENGNNQTNVRQRAKSYLGIDNYIVVQDPNNTYIDHIDCWGKFLAPDKILIRSVPTNHSQYNALEQTAAHFANQMSEYRRPFKVYRVAATSNDHPYTNSLILNNKVFVPIMVGLSNANDNAALRVYQEAMPGYQIFGVVNNTSNPWLSTDALHCRTKELAERRIINIAHIPLPQQMSYTGYVQVNANVQSWTGRVLATNSPRVFYKIGAKGTYQSLPMHNITRANEYMATITGFALTDTLFYYINAVDTAGRTFNHPYIGAPMAHTVSFTLGVPSGFTAIAGNNQVHLQWNAPAFDPSNILTGYRLLRGGQVLTTINDPDLTSYWDFTALNGNTYQYGLVAVYTAGETPMQTVSVSLSTSSAVDIGSGTADDYRYGSPVNFNDRTSVSQTIYLANQINTTGKITHIKYTFRKAANSPAVDATLNLYMGTTTASSFTNNTSWLPYSAFTFVREMAFSVPATGSTPANYTINITLTEPFIYTGGNLAVMIYKTQSSSDLGTGNTWLNTATSQNRTIAYSANVSSINLSSLPTASDLFARYADITLTFGLIETTPVFYPPTNLSGDATDGIVSLNWDAPMTGSTGNLHRYKVYRNDTAIDETADRFFTETNLSNGTYRYYITAVYVSANGFSESTGTAEYTAVVNNTTTTDDIVLSLPTALRGNYPNPFNPTTTIQFTVGTQYIVSSSPQNPKSKTQNHITIEIFNIKGQKVRSLVNAEYDPGVHTVVWNGLSDDGQPVGSGVYFYRMRAGDFEETKRMLMLK